MEYRTVTKVIEVPKGTGKDGFVAVVRRLIELSRVQYINIDARGKIRFERVVREDEPIEPVAMDFSTLMPSHVIRNSEITELEEQSNAAFGIASMFNEAAKNQVYPISFVTGPNTTLWTWHEKTTGITLGRKDTLYGFPLLQDDQIPDWVLILCTGYTRESSMVDTRTCYKMTMPEAHRLLED